MRKSLSGMWWVKGNEQAKFTGRLKYAGGYKPILEIYLMEYEGFGGRSVPDDCVIYGEVFEETQFVQAVTLLGCTAQDKGGIITVQPFLYKLQRISVECASIGMLLNDEEIAQVTCPQNVYLTCPGLDEYSSAHVLERVWKENIPEGRPYFIDDLDRIVYTQPDPITIDFDVGSIAMSLGVSSLGRNLTTQYLIHISLAQAMTETAVNTLIFAEFLSFLSLMTGRREYVKKHSVSVNSSRTGTDSLSIELSYGYSDHSAQEREYTMMQTLLIGREENLRKFSTLFPKWRENFKYIKSMANHYTQMLEHGTEANLLQAFPIIEDYVLERLLNKNKTGMPGILKAAIDSVAENYPDSNVYLQYFAPKRRKQVANQLANYRHKRIHPKSTKICKYSFTEVYTYIEVILRSILMIEMEFPTQDIDTAIGHWPHWHRLPEHS